MFIGESQFHEISYEIYIFKKFLSWTLIKNKIFFKLIFIIII